MTIPQAIAYISIAAGLAALTYFVVQEIQDWLRHNREQQEAHQRAVNEYIQALQQKVLNLQDDLRAAMFRELGHLDERKITSERMKFMAREIACDPDKQTQVLQR